MSAKHFIHGLNKLAESLEGEHREILNKNGASTIAYCLTRASEHIIYEIRREEMADGVVIDELSNHIVTLVEIFKEIRE